jgi:potassium-dependent mechanosensitive channel
MKTTELLVNLLTLAESASGSKTAESSAPVVADTPPADAALESIFESVKRLFFDGFAVGDVTISLWNVTLGLLFFFISLKLGQWVKNRVENKWFLKSKLSKGAREASASLMWYAIVVIAILFSLSIAGIKLSSLALVAGALSLGIGFGLQNIVSNFISGLILLFERPIKRGDWIIVGNTQGFVKDINIRSTQVQTFDFADVLIPNSELLTNQVTNWMLNTSVGRIRIAIGVAYGSDTGKVKDLLIEIARNNPEVVLGHKDYLDPEVLFLRFGDSSLDFELRVFVKDILTTTRTTSAINFEIDRVFREHNIQIPFPQRDIHIIESNGDKS